jgi:hypothetical protein
MNNKQNIAKFIDNVARNDFKKADNMLTVVVNEKIKQRIREADKKLSTGSK